MRRVLITGGAGFIGSHLAEELLRAGDEVRVLDPLVAQVHEGKPRPDYLDPEVELQVGDVRDPGAVERALQGIDAVVHLAARIGVGQSMYEIADYTAANTAGTGVLLQALVRRPVGRLVVASSMSVYGEGLYAEENGRHVVVAERSKEQLARQEWDPKGPQGERLDPVPTPETKPPAHNSVYALTKYDQEQLVLLYGNAYGVPAIALRLFNVYGPRQALSNPYTGAVAIFAARLMNGRAPLIYENGGQRRDFVSVHDVARAFRLALDAPTGGVAVNVGSGRSASVLEVANVLSERVTDGATQPEVTEKARVGDIRHCFADIELARDLLGYEPRVSLEDGLTEFTEWMRTQSADDRFDAAAAELASRGLTV